MPLRYYQEDAASATNLALQECDSVLIHLPTGSGKTVVAANLIKGWLPSRCMFIADADELCEQPMNVINREAGVIPALEKAASRAALTARVIVASAQTLAKLERIQRFPPGLIQYAIIDEAHRGAARDRAIVQHLGCKSIGVTATPFKSGLRDLSDFYETVAYSLPMLNMIEEGFAPPIKVLALPVEIDLSSVSVKRGFDGKDYNLDEVASTIAPYYERIVELLLEHCQGRRTLVRLPLISSSKAFAEIARQHGIKALHVDGTSDDRAAIIEGFKHGNRIEMLCNSQLLTTGVDIPNVDCLVNLSPTSSMAAYQQFMGRGMRVLPGVIDDIPGRDQSAERKARIAASAKPDAMIVDFLWQHDKLTTTHAGHLIATNEDDAAAIYARIKKNLSPEELLAMSKAVQEERELELVKKLEDAAARAGKLISPEVLAFETNDLKLATYESVARWEMKPASEPQIATLARWGVDTSRIRDRGHANVVMNAMMFRFKNNLATVRQLARLRKMGLTVDPNAITISEASSLIGLAATSALR